MTNSPNSMNPALALVASWLRHGGIDVANQEKGIKGAPVVGVVRLSGRRDSGEGKRAVSGLLWGHLRLNEFAWL